MQAATRNSTIGAVFYILLQQEWAPLEYHGTNGSRLLSASSSYNIRRDKHSCAWRIVGRDAATRQTSADGITFEVTQVRSIKENLIVIDVQSKSVSLQPHNALKKLPDWLCIIIIHASLMALSILKVPI